MESGAIALGIILQTESEVISKTRKAQTERVVHESLVYCQDERLLTPASFFSKNARPDLVI
jgi:hypothetical protein